MAFQLGLTLDQLYEMSSKEYMGWIEYFKLRPHGWKEDHRTAILAQTTYQGTKKVDFTEYFPALKVINKASESNINKAKAFIGELQAKAKGNNKINIE